jgi:tetratricopeptide (TPR) repeat protein
MPEPTSDKLQQLFKLLSREPQDSFLLYGIGMEYKKLGASDKAIEHFDRVIQNDPAYCYAYYQRAQVCEQIGKTEEARRSYEAGIIAARKAGDAHAQSELESALAMME